MSRLLESPAPDDQIRRAYEEMRDLCRQAQDGWGAERKRLWAAESAIAEALHWLEAEGNTGTGYVNRIWGAKAALKKVAAATAPPSPSPPL